MKLYVWKTPYQVPYGDSCLYVIASNLREARKQAKQAHTAQYGRFNDKTADRSVFINYSPDRVHNLPYAECYEWSE